MFHSSFTRFGLITLAVAAGIVVWQITPTRAQSTNGTGPGIAGGPEVVTEMDKVLVKDYNPRSNLVVPEHHPAKAKFPVIDAHVHPRAKTPEDVAKLVKVMDATGVDVAVILTGATGEAFDKLVALYLKPYPKRFLMYCGMDVRGKDYSDPEFPKKVAAELERCYRMGARGVGEVTDKGRGFGSSSTVEGTMLPRDKRLHVDDHRLDLFWDKCAELKIPVSLHIADHPSAWQPPDKTQERAPSFQRYNQYGRDVPTHAELITKFQTMMDRHPKTTFVAVHFSNLGHDFAQLGKALDRFPNLNVDLSARAYEFGRQPFTAPPFFEKYKDRIVYGSDQDVSEEMWRRWWRVIETRDEFIKGPAGWHLYGLGLPDDVLKAIYQDNAKRLFNWN